MTKKPKAAGGRRVPRGRLAWLAALAALLVALPAPALASHNSAGVHAAVATPDEVGDGGVAPDVPADRAPAFHPELDPPRPAPADQSGERYRADEGCTPASAYEDADGQLENPTAYRRDLREGEACYVGALDGRLLHMQFTQIFSIHRSEDLLYPANPAEDDGYCRGQQDPEDHSGPSLDDGGPADELVASLERRDDAACQAETHDQRLPGYLGVDTALLEAPAEAGLDAAGQATGSGTLTLPTFATPYVFLFGQPHPAADPAPYEAGAGPFGPNPLEGGSPLTDLTGACGDRTHDCRLLTPEDLKRYDEQADELEAAGVPTVGDVARLCLYMPTFPYEHPQPDTRLCGTDGRPMNEYLEPRTDGGFGAAEAPTWLSVLPGWYRASVIYAGGAATSAAEAADTYAEDPVPEPVHQRLAERDYALPTSDDTGGDHDPRKPFAYTVNPRVPLPEDGLDCLTPNVLADGPEGVYGDYRADAFDLDVYRSAAGPAERAAVDATHEDLRPLVATAEDTLPGRDADPELPLVPDEAEDGLGEGLDRGDPVATEPDEDPGQPEFHVDRPDGITCTPEGDLERRATATRLDGHLRVAADLVANTANDKQIPSFPQPPGVHPKDPTAGDGLAPPTDGEPRAWYPDAYGLEGAIHAVLDTNANDRLDPCATESDSGPVDRCLWKALWDAYNDACRGPDGAPCGDLIADRGYDLDAGVGLVATIEVTGPVAVYDEDLSSSDTTEERTRVVGSDPAATNCVVATSTGLADRLAEQRGLRTTDGLADALCPENPDGETALIEDGFADQTADTARAGAVVEPGDVDLDVNWVPLAPTPAATEDATGFGEDDRVCLTGVFDVAEGEVASDTDDSLGLTGENRFTDCHPL